MPEAESATAQELNAQLEQVEGEMANLGRRAEDLRAARDAASRTSLDERIAAAEAAGNVPESIRLKRQRAGLTPTFERGNRHA
jgi:hypothetical protein